MSAEWAPRLFVHDLVSICIAEKNGEKGSRYSPGIIPAFRHGPTAERFIKQKAALPFVFLEPSTLVRSSNFEVLG